MNALGDKVGSALIAQAAGVPTLAWSGSHVSLTFSLITHCLIFVVDAFYNLMVLYIGGNSIRTLFGLDTRGDV